MSEQRKERYLVTTEGDIFPSFFGEENRDVFDHAWDSPIWGTSSPFVFHYSLNGSLMFDHWTNLPFRGYGEKGH